MSVKKIKSSQWWLAMVAFLAGMAFYAGASANRPQTQVVAPTASVTAPMETGVRFAEAGSDTCDQQLD